MAHLLCKDLSRIGRNYLQTGFYTEIMFRQVWVHFIAVANNIDSDEQESSEFAPFLNIMNEWYLRDPVQEGCGGLPGEGQGGQAHLQQRHLRLQERPGGQRPLAGG